MEPRRHYLHKLNNRVQSLLLIGSMSGLMGLLGWIIAGSDGLIWSVVLCLAAMLLGPSVSPRFVLRLYGAREIHPREAPELYRIVEALARRAELPRAPRLHYIPSRILNAFAVGSRNDAAIAVTDGLLRTLGMRELVGVLGHELSHVRHNDMWVMGLADAVTRITLALSQAGILLLLLMLPMAWLGEMQISLSLLAVLILIVAPLISTLLQLALSRTREYDADLGGAELTGDPRGLASALDKLERYQGGWVERIFVTGRRVPDPSVLRTHPPTQERIRRLLALAPEQVPAPRLRMPRHGLSMLEQWPGIAHGPRWHWNGLWY